MQAVPQRSMEQLQSIWQSLGIDANELQPDSDGTILPTTQPPLAEEGLLPLVLPRLALEGVDSAPELRLGQTLGQGGMGVIKLASQLALDREVAVKLVRDEQHREQAVRALLREARVMGALEHPNIVPVHALGCDANGVPMLVMKRIQGVTWGQMLRDQQHPAWARHQGERLELHLDVLIQVCNAVSFAHSKGIVHRDLKPDNVMIGEFGEVYVVDWGVAVSLRDAAGSVLPLARDVRTVAGTPQYMAPEMAVVDAARINERTDVYLLGAVLHECLTGSTRHDGSSVLSALLQAYVSPPMDYPPSVPRELAATCNRACHVEPEQRHASVEELRDAIVRFRRHRSSTLLCGTALERLEALRQIPLLQPAAPRRGARTGILAGEDAPQRYSEIHRLFSECRFGFGHALSTWSGNEAAGEGLDQALQLMAGHEIARGDAQAAGALIDELQRCPRELNNAFQQLHVRLAQEQEQVERLRRLEQQLDPLVGARTRSIIAMLVATLFGALPLVTGLGQRFGWWRIGLGTLLVHVGALVLVLALVNHLARAAMMATAVNRRMVNAVRVLLCVLLAIPPAAALAGLDVNRAVVLIMLAATVTGGTVAVAVERRLIWSFVVYLAGFLLGARFVGAAFEILGACNVVALLHLAVVWRSAQAEGSADKGAS